MTHSKAERPRAPACARNRDPILAVLKTILARPARVLEIGSGTGEHAVYFAQAMPHLVWQTSDRSENHPGIEAWLDHAKLDNVLPPLELDVGGGWPAAASFDAAFTANSLHIMSWSEVEAFFAGVGTALAQDSRLVVYGPFKYNGQFTSGSNAAFDQSLRSRNPDMGIRDFEAVDALAADRGMKLLADQGMPANNRCLVWRRT